MEVLGCYLVDSMCVGGIHEEGSNVGEASRLKNDSKNFAEARGAVFRMVEILSQLFTQLLWG